MHLTNLGAAAEALANIVDLTSIQDSKITKVNLYPSRAEIIRLFVVTVMAGPNRVNISGLPVAVDKDSVRVTGKGSATINDVVISVMPPSSHSAGARSTSLKNLFRKRARTEKAITRCQDSISSLKMYLGTMSTHDIEVHKVSTFTEGYETAVSHLDEKILDLEEQLALVNEEIEQEESKHGLDKEDVLRTHVGIDLEALSDGQIEILLNYAVDDCSWKANYDVRANLDSDDKTLAVTYKASITQNTGEAWDKVPLTLETVNPTFGADIPDLRPWTISVQRYHSFYTMYSGIRSSSIPPAPSRRAAPSVTGAAQSPGEMHGTEAELEPLAHQSTSVTTKGVISAIFEVADLITIPSDKATHNVTVSQISMDASMSWVTVPKARSKAHLKARITNTSEYTFLEGNANIFVNGSFTASSSMPAASPQEIFDLALGRSDFLTCEQRITLFNSKSVPVDIKVIDQIPISGDKGVTVKLLSPALPASSAQSLSSVAKQSSKTASKEVNVAEGVVARWEGPDNQMADPEALGKDGKISWLCALAPQATLHLSLKWEVTSSEGRDIHGL
ncbi:hypothetical protein FPV67DRAFT_1666137 [Lyophyllum atratum]|nr:hypothetical protein FPV67DRAFT_1666137 [Lyophyllum atratum]